MVPAATFNSILCYGSSWRFASRAVSPPRRAAVQVEIAPPRAGPTCFFFPLSGLSAARVPLPLVARIHYDARTSQSCGLIAEPDHFFIRERGCSDPSPERRLLLSAAAADRLALRNLPSPLPSVWSIAYDLRDFHISRN